MNFKLDLYLDTRRPKKDGTYPVKIRVWDAATKKAKLYPSGIDLSEREFQAAWQTVKPRKEHLPTRERLEALKGKAAEIASNPFGATSKDFDRKLGRPKGEGQNVFWHFAQLMDEAKTEGRHSTASGYGLAVKMILEFQGKREAKADHLPFAAITPEWLKAFEQYAIKTGRTLTTISIYLRSLRTVFNKAIRENEIDRDLYPFGKGSYTVPAVRKVKKALSKEQLGHLFRSEPVSPDQQRAKAFFFFSYASNGMNVKDIALLKWADLEAAKFTFYRAKTATTTRDNLTPITVYLTDFHREVIKRYGTDPTASRYVFPILEQGMSSEAKHRAVQAFTRFINQHLKKLCKSIGLPAEVSTYWARHSFATVGIRQGMSMEFMREALGHKDMKTTTGYFMGFEDQQKREFASQLLDFTT